MQSNKVSDQQKHRLLPVFLFLFLAAAYVVVVYPSLSGGFVLDDWPNLSGLATIDKTRGAWSYIFDGTSSSLGRQVSYSTFALQANDWPENPVPFKIVNLVIHLLNSLLLFSLILIITKLIGYSRSVGVQLSLAAALIWTILPIHASTVFYVVQRMTLLSLSFTLIGLISFAVSCLLYRQRRYRQSSLLLGVGMGFGYLLGILSKENAILMGIFAFAIYKMIPNEKRQYDGLWKTFFYACCFIPLIALILYLLIDNRYLSAYGNRDFDLTQRLLTEPVILWDYLKKIVLPSAYSLNLYNDGFPIANDLWGKPYSGLSIIAWFLVALAAYTFRKPAPYLLFGFVWYIGGHLLESTAIGLELYFEHRNYVPSIGIIIGLVFGIHHLSGFIIRKAGDKTSRTISLIMLVGGGLYLAWLIIVLRVESEAWGDPHKFAMASLSERPLSLRAYQDAAAYFANNQDFHTSHNLLEEIDRKWPGYSTTIAQKILIHCLAPEIRPPASEMVLDRFKNGKFDLSVTDTLNEIMKVKKQGGCSAVSWEAYRIWLEALFVNPNLRVQNQNIIVLLAYSYNAEEKFSDAAKALYRLESSSEDIGYMILKARFTAMAGNFNEALGVIGEIRRIYSNQPQSWLPHKGIVENLEYLIKAELKADKIDE